MYESLQLPEQRARVKIDEMLTLAGWEVQNFKEINLGSSFGIAVREYPTDTGPADYILFVDREAIGVIEAKKEGVILTTVEEQTSRYANSKLKWIEDNKKLLFLYESTGIITRFTDNRDIKPRSREIFHFHSPHSLFKKIKNKRGLRERLTDIPPLNNEGLRLCQINAITNLEESLKEARPRALVQMATGSGKTFTAITSIYRLLKFAKAKRILFLVDTKNLGKQADQEFSAFTPNDDNRKFTELYSVQLLNSSFIDSTSQVCISTIQRMYSILSKENIDESAEEINPNELKFTETQAKEVSYNPEIPIDFFDFIVIDECHRSIYNLWKQVLDYFDAFFIGLTATPDKRTFGFFNENVVSEYSHEKAVIDGVNVQGVPYIIETEITSKGSKLTCNQYVDIRNRLTRKSRWTQLDTDIEYSERDLDRKVVNISQIRNIIKAFKEKITTEIFPGRLELPKTLIFAKTDSHADDIIKIIRDEFNESNDFCRKITYSITKNKLKPEDELQKFRTAYNPRIAVTVDMIATGTDIRPLECLLFMRDVKSKGYFEQMKGRGTRTISLDDLRKVTPSARYNKDHYVLIDAVGVSKSVKTDTRPLERNKSVSTKDLMQHIIMGNRNEDYITSLAGRLTMLERQIKPEEKEKIKELTGGKVINDIAGDLLDAFDPDIQIERAKKDFNLDRDTEPSKDQLKSVEKALVKESCKVFDNPKLRDFLIDVRRNLDQVIDTTNLDKVTYAGFKEDIQDFSKTVIEKFKQFIEDNRDEIIAYRIFYNQPYNRKELTFKMIKELNEKLSKSPYDLTPEKIWKAYAQNEENRVKGANSARKLTDIISLLRFEMELVKELRPFDDSVNQNFKEWVFKKNAGHIQFSEEQMEWLRMIKDHIITSVSIDRDDFENTPFAERGGLMKIWNLFGDKMDGVIEELNQALVG
ncbi:MAG: DEAD/DEAH box helicase family protein [Candidatus Delongbacteria bacterium]|nr:DEAD/DEAH box helicase family protein [Candidatus Delongbacteria bacterium]MBN2833472.1 DEAD/DEAH box helicase family protein [Candidatus Delongbacteria bacterium]